MKVIPEAKFVLTKFDIYVCIQNGVVRTKIDTYVCPL